MQQPGTVTAPANMSLSDAVKDAFTKDGIAGDTELTPDNTTGETKVTKPAPTEKNAEQTAKTEEVDDTFEVDASAEEIGHALALHRAVTDPKTRAGIITELASKAGIDLTKPAEVKQMTTDLTEILKESLGDEYDLLSGAKLALAIEKAIKIRLDQALNPITTRIAEREAREQQEQADSAMGALWDRQKVDAKERPKVAELMMKKMRQVAPGEGANAHEYLDDIYSLVQRDVEKARAVKTTVKRIVSNAQDVNRTSGDGGTDDTRLKTGSKLPSISEAVAAAFRNERLED